jgi:hypothetical protein
MKTLETLPSITVSDVSTLTNNTVFLKVSFSVIGNTKQVRDNVLSTDADVSLLRVNKQLLESPELDAIRKADMRMRQYLYNTALPFDTGVMLLPVGLIENTETRLQEYAIERAGLITEFVNAYPALCAVAVESLGSLHKVSDYADSPDAIRGKFSFTHSYLSFGVPGQLKSISSHLFQSELDKQHNVLMDAVSNAQIFLREQLLQMVSHLQERLTPTDDGKTKRLHATAVTSLQEFLAIVDLRNVSNDTELQAVADKVKALISGVSVDTLKTSETFKANMVSKFDGIKATLADLVENAPGRKFRK